MGKRYRSLAIIDFSRIFWFFSIVKSSFLNPLSHIIWFSKPNSIVSLEKSHIIGPSISNYPMPHQKNLPNLKNRKKIGSDYFVSWLSPHCSNPHFEWDHHLLSSPRISWMFKKNLVLIAIQESKKFCILPNSIITITCCHQSLPVVS